MNNTLMAVEAMRMSELALRRPDKPNQPLESDLDWKALEHFLASCQNLPGRSNNPSLRFGRGSRRIHLPSRRE